MAPTRRSIALLATLGQMGCSSGDSAGGKVPGADASVEPTPYVDPGSGEWARVDESELAAVCKLDARLLKEADRVLGVPYAVVRYGQLCWEFYPEGAVQATTPEENFSTTKTLGATVLGIAAHETRTIARSGRKTGPISDEDRVDHWLDEVSFNSEARISHVLSMLAHNRDLRIGQRAHAYDSTGDVQINRLDDIIDTAINQDPERLGANTEEFTRRFLFEPLGMRHSTWSDGAPSKIFGYTWRSPIRDMARLGLLLLNEGFWSGKRVLSQEWVYRMTHPAFEDANTGYGYLTWLNARSNWSVGGVMADKLDAPRDPCAPSAIHREHPHGLSESLDCGYEPASSCAQNYDVGMWYAEGLGGQEIVGHEGLDLVLVAKDIGNAGPARLWQAVRPALLAHDETYLNDEAGFCRAYAANEYAPDLHR
jgi:hypothetical protein